MCGIFGIFSRIGLRDVAALRRASDVVAHRGPDGAGAVWFDTRRRGDGTAPVFVWENWTENVAPTLLLAHRRLAIIDLSEQGAQPMAISSGSLWITYNGELYNFIELRSELEQLGATFHTRSDTEVVLKAYEVWGPDAVSRFAGMWSFALLDLRKRQLFLSRDRFGIKPLHYYANGDEFAFASEIKQLLELPKAPRGINERAVYDYLQYEATDTGAETFFAGIRKVRPGHNLLISLDGGDIKESCYYAPPTEPPSAIGAREAAECFRALLKESIRIHLRSDVPVGTCLSGGLDSSSIAMLMREVARDEGMDIDRHAFSCHFDFPEANELEFTKASIEAAEVIPHFVEPKDSDIHDELRKLIWHQDEPFGSTSIYAQWSVFRLVKQTGIKVVLDGQGADEMLGGYASTVPHFLLELIAQGRILRALWESRRWASLQGKPWHTQVPLPRLRKALARLAGASKQPPAASEESWLNPDFQACCAASSDYVRNVGDRPHGQNGHFANVLHQFFFLNNLPSLLRYEDRNSMAFSVEARVPFLDHRIVDFAFSLPSEIKIRDGYTKRVLRDAMAGTLPEKIRMRGRKMGFATPERRWQAGPLRGLVLDAIEGDKLRPYVQKNRALKHFHRVTEQDVLSFAPWRWVNLSLWMEEFGLA